MSRMQVTPTWNTTNPRLTRPTRWLVLPRPPSFKAYTMLAREDIQAGSRPETTAASKVAATVKISTGVSMSKVIQEGGGLSRLRKVALSQPTARDARPIPSTAPMPATRRLSVSICRTRRVRVAPREDLMASSFARREARANCMFITLTQAMRSTPRQKASMVSNVPRKGRGVKVLMRGWTSAALKALLVSA